MSIDLEQIIDARLAVARLGELDAQAWWRSDGVLSDDGAFVGPRVLPRSHHNARARIIFAVASHACNERYPEPKAFHLFKLTPELEDQLDDYLQGKLGDDQFWDERARRLEKVQSGDAPESVFLDMSLISQDEISLIKRLQLGPGGQSLAIRKQNDPQKLIRLLTAGFIRSAPRQLVVPYTYEEVG